MSSSKSSILSDLQLSNCTTKSSITVPHFSLHIYCHTNGTETSKTLKFLILPLILAVS